MLMDLPDSLQAKIVQEEFTLLLNWSTISGRAAKHKFALKRSRLLRIEPNGCAQFIRHVYNFRANGHLRVLPRVIQH